MIIKGIVICLYSDYNVIHKKQLRALDKQLKKYQRRVTHSTHYIKKAIYAYEIMTSTILLKMFLTILKNKL